MRSYKKLIVPGLLLFALAACTGSDQSSKESSSLSSATSLTQLSELRKEVAISVTLAGDVKNLKAIAGAENLKELQILGSTLESLEGLDSLAKLESLFIQSQSLPKLQGLKSNTLKTLWIDSAVLSDVSSLAQLPNLEELYIYTNGPLNLEALKSLPKLKTLWVKSSGQAELSQIAGLSQLTELWLYNDQLTSLDSLASLSQLKSLTVRSLKLQDITAAPARLAQLESFQLISTPVSSLAPIEDMAKLSALGLVDLKGALSLTPQQKAQIKSLNLTQSSLDLASGGFKGFSSLETLAIDASNVPLAQIEAPALQYLTTHYANRKSSDFSAFPNLEILGSSHSGLSDIEGLSGKKALNFADISFNSIASLAPLAYSQKLRFLDISKNGLSSVSSLPQIAELETVKLASNPLSDLRPLKVHPNLFELDVSYTQTNYQGIAELFKRPIGGVRPLWLSMLECKGITDAEKYFNCYEDPIPSGDSIGFLEIESRFYVTSLEQQTAYLESLDKLAAEGDNLDLPSCAWARNHLQLIETFERSFDEQRATLASKFSWTEPKVGELETQLCANGSCSLEDLNRIYKVDLMETCGINLDRPHNVEALSKVIKDISLLPENSPQARSIDYLGSVEEKTMGAFVSYLRKMENKLRSLTDRDSAGMINIANARAEAKQYLEATLSQAEAFLSKAYRVQEHLGRKLEKITDQLNEKVSQAKAKKDAKP